MPELAEKPLNREPDLNELISSFITREANYDRNHSELPAIDENKHIVRVDGAVKGLVNLSISNLKNDYEQHTVVCALQCAGNRRHTMRTKLKEVQGIDWFDGAVMNCKWTGPRIRDVLLKAGIALSESEQENAHVAFACHAAPCQDDDWYGASIPLWRALRKDADAILALEMNGRPLLVKHGYPVRTIIPGYAGARAVKWLDRITVQRTESDNFYQQHDYKALPEDAVDSQTAKKFWDSTPSIEDMPVNSIIALPERGSLTNRSPEGTITVKGYALPSGDGGPIVKVEVSADRGETWKEADLLCYEEEGKWSWKLWEARLAVQTGENKTVHSRATDSKGNTQPKECAWNLRGVCYNGYGEVSELTFQ